MIPKYKHKMMTPKQSAAEYETKKQDKQRDNKKRQTGEKTDASHNKIKQ